jgi:hypothetical protein
MDFSLVRLAVTLETGRPPTAATPLPAVRTVFHEAFRRAAGCWLPGNRPCAAGPDCPCRPTFAQALSSDPEAVRRYQKPPLPFVFTLPLDPAAPVVGQRLELTLTLVGTAVNHLETYLAALAILAELQAPAGVRATLGEVASLDPAGNRSLLRERGGQLHLDRLVITAASDLFLCSPPAPGRALLTCLTPLRLLHQGHPLQEFSFPVLAGALFRRISALAYYYGDTTLPYDFKWLARQSREVAVQSVDSRWVSWGGTCQGGLGRFILAGDLTELWPFLVLGSLLQVGKGASYGLGSYRLEPLPA